MLKFLITLFIITLNGCGLSWTTNRAENPLIADHVDITQNDVQVIATKASHRLGYISPNNSTALICLEPLPDVAETFSAAVADALKVAATDKVDIENSYTSSIATQITQLVYRTQGLQLYRNGMHSLCVNRINDARLKLKFLDETKINGQIPPDVLASIKSDANGGYDLTKINTIFSQNTTDSTKNNKEDAAVHIFDKSYELIALEIKEVMKNNASKNAIPDAIPSEKNNNPKAAFNLIQKTKEIWINKTDRTGSLIIIVDKLPIDSIIELTVDNAIIVSAVDEKGTSINLPLSETLTIKKDSRITFQLSNIDSGDVVVKADGKSKAGQSIGTSTIKYTVKE